MVAGALEGNVPADSFAHDRAEGNVCPGVLQCCVYRPETVFGHKNNEYYQPSKETAVACCFGLKLSLRASEELLRTAGYSLSLSIPWDRVIYYCLGHNIKNLNDVNELLYYMGEKCIGVRL